MLRRALGIGIALLACAAFAGESTDVDPLRAPHRNADGTFFNPWLPFRASYLDFLRWRFSSNAYDKSAAPVLPRVANDGRSLAGLQHSSELTWVGHATVAIHDGDDVVLTDPHSPSKFRVMGPMVNHPGFAGTFSCDPGTAMNPPNKCEVW